MNHVIRGTNRSHRSHTRDRRAARVRISLIWACALGMLLAWVGVWHGAVPWISESGGVALAAPPPTDDPCTSLPDEDDPTAGGPGPGPSTEIPDAQPGAPRPWEVGLTVSPYSTVNVLNRNVLTVMPIVGWTGVGPDMQMNLYHNSATVDATFDTTRGMGFDLGPGWTTSFSAHLFEVGTDDRIVVGNDGTRDLFTWDGSGWVAPSGVHRALSFDATTSKYTLKYNDQSFDTFDVDGLLIAVVDAVGNQISIQRVNERIDTVTDASGRLFQFVYVGSNLDRIIDPKEDSGSNPLITLQQREWTFAYDGEGRMSAVTDPMALLNDFQFDDAGHITQIRDKYDPNDLGTPAPGWYVFEYEGHVTRDPNALRNVTDPLNTQQFFHVVGDGLFRFHVDYTNRRGYVWAVESWQPLPEVLIESPPVAAILNPLGQRTTLDYDTDRNMIRYTNALGNAWTLTYDANGNTTSLASPLHIKGEFFHKQIWAYDEYPEGDPLEGQIFNNLTSYTDAEGNVTTYKYAEVGFPKLLTSIVEPETVPGEGTALTRFEYYIAPFSTTTCNPTGEPDNNECKHGQLETMTDPNHVVTSFDYDRWGQTHFYREGQVSGVPVFERRTVSDSGSRTYIVETGNGAARCGGSTGRTNFNQNNHPTGGFCLIPQTPVCPSRAETAPIPPNSTPDLDEFVTSGEWHSTLDPMCRTTHMEIDLTFERFGPVFTRSIDSHYDPLGALVNTVSDTEENAGPPRQFDYPYDLSTGIFTRVGPDLVETVTTLDEANRVESIVRRIPFVGVVLMLAFYDYYADGRVRFVTFLNLARTEYTYDAAGRVTVIDHRNDLGLSLLTLNYVYDKRNLPTRVTEVHWLNPDTITNFTYDNRGRLTGEIRTGTAPYDLLYEYDKGGNRRRKVDVLNEIEMLYEYDLDNTGYRTANNRLRQYITCDMSTAGAVCDRDLVTDALVSYTVYHYNDVGNVTRVFVYRRNPAEGEPKVTATRFVYARNGTTVSYVIGEAWEENSEPCHDRYEKLGTVTNGTAVSNHCHIMRLRFPELQSQLVAWASHERVAMATTL
ncbi:MAG: RHS repeat protein [Planctomycetes bacterium]|nr:RHS repeat protein [Planctomycetota bacterium]